MATPEKRWLALLDWQRLHLAVAGWAHDTGAQIAADLDGSELRAAAVFSAAAEALAGHPTKPPQPGLGQKRTVYVQTG